MNVGRWGGEVRLKDYEKMTRSCDIDIVRRKYRVYSVSKINCKLVFFNVGIRSALTGMKKAGDIKSKLNDKHLIKTICK